MRRQPVHVGICCITVNTSTIFANSAALCHTSKKCTIDVVHWLESDAKGLFGGGMYELTCSDIMVRRFCLLFCW